MRTFGVFSKNRSINSLPGTTWNNLEIERQVFNYKQRYYSAMEQYTYSRSRIRVED
jgi:hypothetical protein